ncbi:MAG: UDP-glucose 4-epimerase GalE [Actinobacteria bacterium]|uniref:Unannotated protein n=1 Tax=freshwater metagenome TaxID=449393 RepID=A0A6J5YQC2_9ZZZZ|nr:UDP-glucose 4-epimerase GalE [Actinomycetota bacterium]
MTWLITGGAGYIGGHVVAETLNSGREVVVLDDLSTGIRSRVPELVPFEQVSLQDRNAVCDVFSRYPITGVLHLAAKKQVGESMIRPDHYWQENVGGLINLLEAMSMHHVTNFVFSSSAAVYGEPNISHGELLRETATCNPINTYGATKLMGEWLSNGYVAIDGLTVAALRYFNVAGAGQQHLGDTFALNLVPIVLTALDKNEAPTIFGNDYPTPDGTCIRDYVHVQDLALAHVAAMTFVEKSDPGFESINVGTGIGSSVSQVIQAIAQAKGIDISPSVSSRRAGDPPALAADVTKAKELLAWQSRYDLTDIVTSAVAAWEHNKNSISN